MRILKSWGVPADAHGEAPAGPQGRAGLGRGPAPRRRGGDPEPRQLPQPTLGRAAGGRSCVLKLHYFILLR